MKTNKLKIASYPPVVEVTFPLVHDFIKKSLIRYCPSDCFELVWRFSFAPTALVLVEALFLENRPGGLQPV